LTPDHRPRDGVTLTLAASGGDIAARDLLHKFGVDLVFEANGETPLHVVAAKWGTGLAGFAREPRCGNFAPAFGRPLAVWGSATERQRRSKRLHHFNRTRRCATWSKV